MNFKKHFRTAYLATATIAGLGLTVASLGAPLKWY
jgi:hypothetical protein